MTESYVPAISRVHDIPKESSQAHALLAGVVAALLVELTEQELPGRTVEHLYDLVDQVGSVHGGVPVSVAAALLDVSPQTVRTWIKRQVLATVPDARPTKVTPRSLGEVLAAVTELRKAATDEPRLLWHLASGSQFGDLRRYAEEIVDRVEVTEGELEELFA